jgi:flavin-dependent dehydrogenase
MEAPMTLSDTIGLKGAARAPWDAVVIGAGPAGSLAAHELARAGRRVLLVDKALFPRWKVCGSCLNGRCLAELRAAGLGALPGQLGAVPFQVLQLAARGRHARIPLAEGVAVSRPTFDSALVTAAISQGALFLPHCSAVVDGGVRDGRLVHLRTATEEVTVHCRIVLAASGIGSRPLDELEAETEANSRIGAGVLTDRAAEAFAIGTVYMACGDGGYVGLVRVEDGRLDIAAALDPEAVRHAGGPGRAAGQILHGSGFPQVPELEELPWRGTPLLTRRPRRVAGERVFVLGDAAGYVEPFTGEGIGWALASARAVAPLALAAIEDWEPALMQRWQSTHRRIVSNRQLVCRLTSRVLRSPWLTGAVVSVLSHAPGLARPVVRRLNQVSA